MRHSLKASSLAAAVLTLADCGGSDSESPDPVTPAIAFTGDVLAGIASGSAYIPGDTEPGCTDGAAISAKLQPSIGVLGRAADGRLLLAELGSCDSRNRILAIDPAGNTLKTLATGSILPGDEQEALNTFLTPTSIAASPSGEIYIGDSDMLTGQVPSALREIPGRGPGIWKLAANGTVSMLAGVAQPSVGQTGTGLDGQGAAASFGYLGAMCYGSDGLLYITDNTHLRTVSTGGAVSTVTTAGVKQQAVLACGPDGSVLVRRRFENLADDDYYDPIARKSIAKASAVGKEFSPLAYFGPASPSVVIETYGTAPTLALLSLADGSTATIAKIASPGDLAATPPTLSEVVRAGVATSSKNFGILSNRALFQFTRK